MTYKYLVLVFNNNIEYNILLKAKQKMFLLLKIQIQTEVVIQNIEN